MGGVRDGGDGTGAADYDDDFVAWDYWNEEGEMSFWDLGFGTFGGIGGREESYLSGPYRALSLSLGRSRTRRQGLPSCRLRAG